MKVPKTFYIVVEKCEQKLYNHSTEHKNGRCSTDLWCVELVF